MSAAERIVARYLGAAVVLLRHVGGGEYAGRVEVGPRSWPFEKLFAPRIGFRHAYDSNEAFDEMAESAVAFGSYYTTSNRPDDLGEIPDWAPPGDVADAVDAAVWSLSSGDYPVQRSPDGAYVNAFTCRTCERPEALRDEERYQRLCENCFYERAATRRG